MIKFVKRPRFEMTMLEALRETSKNGKAVIANVAVAGSNVAVLRAEGLALRQRKNGKHVYAWCEPIKKGVRR